MKITICPICGSDVDRGYGLAFGPGIGTYAYCLDDYALGCMWSVKHDDDSATVEVELQ